MAEEFLSDSVPDLKELENKIGRKTPESLLIWMKDAADCGETWSCDVDDNRLYSDDISEKINNLKQEMRWLRSTDVRILRQLIAVHEGIEAMRWLVDDRGALASQTSSLTGSLSSLGTDEPGLSVSRYRESLACPQDLTETTAEDLAPQPLHAADGVIHHKSPFSLSSEYTPDRHHSSLSAYTFEISHSPRSRLGQAESQPQASDGALIEKKADADPIRSALLRSGRISRREENAGIYFSRDYDSEEAQTELQLQESCGDFQNDRTNGDEKIGPEEEKVLLGYDAQWCWVESQDDVTFL